MYDTIKLLEFRDIDLTDNFFDSLRNDYQGFDDWFLRKANEGKKAYVLYDKVNKIEAFLHLKLESEEILTRKIKLKKKNRLKIATLKINPHGTILGERFLSLALYWSLHKVVEKKIPLGLEEIYVTIFPKHVKLVELFKKYGFKEASENVKGEKILIKPLYYRKDCNIEENYPFITKKNVNKYILAIKPEYHTKLFPYSKLNTESSVYSNRDISYSNSIRKSYISNIIGLSDLKKGDLLLMKRTAEDNKPAKYSSVVSSLCTVIGIQGYDNFSSYERFKEYLNKTTVLEEEDLLFYYRSKKFIVVDMIYNCPFENRIIHKKVSETLGYVPDYWGFVKINDDQFSELIKLGGINESIIIN